MNYFCILEQCQRGDLDFWFLAAKRLSRISMVPFPPKAQEVFQGIDFVGAPI